MKIIGIIAEYNPFHNGHAYQIQRIKEKLHADFVVVAMSGDFVQRGTPAIVNKYIRAKMALGCGADLIIELPVLWATASAESFAMAGVTLFDKMGCVDGICFGAETDDLPLLTEFANILVEEPISYRNLLSAYLKEGLSFPVARSKALCDYFTSNESLRKDTELASISSILNEPNNILAIEYLKAILRRNSSLTPYVIKREGAGYHEESILEANNVPTASATAIRKELENSLSLNKLTTSIPAFALEVLKETITTKHFITANDFSSILGYQLLTYGIENLAEIGDSNHEIANRLAKNRMSFSSFEQFCELCKSKDMTYTRMSRILLHLILNITNQAYLIGKESDYIPYLRILGFRKDASILFKEIKRTSQVPLISKLADVSALLDEKAMYMLGKDIHAADLYEQTCGIKNKEISQSEYAKQIVQIK